MTARTFALNVLIVFGSVACQSVPRLANTYNSPEALAAAVLDALAHQDRARLDGLTLSEKEFRDHVWPDLPAARPERNLPFSYVWGDLHQKSQLRLSATLQQHGGHWYTLERIAFEGETPYSTYRVHRDASFTVRPASGAESTIRVCGSMIEKDGMWKVFSYLIDD